MAQWRSNFVGSSMLTAVKLSVGAAMIGSIVAHTAAAADPQLQARIAKAAIPFVPNAGQWDDDVAFAARVFAGGVEVTRSGALRYSLRPTPDHAAGTAPRTLVETIVDHRNRPRSITPTGISEQPARISYFIGEDASRHRAGLPSYERVDLGEVYRGIGAHLRASGNNVEKIFTVAPGADPSQIRIRVENALRLDIGEHGELIAKTSGGLVSFTAPVAFQRGDDGIEVPIDVRYATDQSGTFYRFVLGKYNRSRALTIDPLLASTYFGGNGADTSYAMAISPVDGTVYVTGFTMSTAGFPTTGGAFITHAGAGQGDAFVVRFSADLGTLLAGTYFGGTLNETAYAIVINEAGQPIIAGDTTSNNLPVGDGTGAQPTKQGTNTNGFIAMFSPSLNAVVRTTHMGGPGGPTRFRGIALASDALYVTGSTKATTLPMTAGAAQPTGAGDEDAVVARLGLDLKSHVRTTYFGGGGFDSGDAIAVHPQSGDVYVAGFTNSSSLPAVAGGGQSIMEGSDGFIARLSADLGAVRQSTFYGGSEQEVLGTLAIHPITGEVYAGGSTASPTLPNTAGSAQPSYAGGSQDGLVVRASADLRTILRATYFGSPSGFDVESVTHIAVHPVSGEVYAAGIVVSSSLPGTANGIQSATGGGLDAFVTRFRATLASSVQTTFFGGGGPDGALAMAIHPLTRDVYLSGYTSSDNLPGAASGAFTSRTGANDGFVARLSPDLTLLDKTPNPFAFTPVFGAVPGTLVYSIPVQVTGFTGALPTYLTGGGSARYCISTNADCTCDIVAFTSGITVVSLTAGRYVCMRDRAGLQGNETTLSTLHAGGGAATFMAVTGPVLSSPCTLDVDGNGTTDALTDGLIMLRALFGLTGSPVTSNAVAPNATRATWTQLQQYLNANCGTGFQP